MASRFLFVLCVEALLLQLAYSQCLGRIGAGPYTGLASSAFAAPVLYDGCGVASTGGSLAVTSASPVAPTGVSVLSENAIEGSLCAGGSLPLLGSVILEGAFPTEGAGAISYGCGDGAVAIASEGPVATGILAPEYFAPSGGLINQGIANGYGFGIGGYGQGVGYGSECGCGTFY